MSKKLITVLSLFGLLDATYLSIIKFTESKALCMPGIGDCWTVNTSKYSEWNGIPISFFGIAAYLTILFILSLSKRIKFLETYGDFLIFGVTTIGFIFSGYLTYLQITVIQAICPFCIVSAITMTSIFVISLVKIVNEI